jgi:hypothetical protein
MNLASERCRNSYRADACRWCMHGLLAGPVPLVFGVNRGIQPGSPGRNPTQTSKSKLQFLDSTHRMDERGE